MSHHAPRFIGVYQGEVLRHAMLANVPLYFRVYLAALGSTYSDGHAPFFIEELAATVTSVNQATGEVGRTPNPGQLRKAIREAKAEGLLHPSSTVRCLVLPRHVATHGTGRQGASRCRVSGHS